VSNEQILAGIADGISRRRVLNRASIAAAALVTGLFGKQQSASAHHCCGLCKGNQGSCSGCHCIWCWGCCETGRNYWHQCCECYNSSGTCGGGCTGVYCSYSRVLRGCITPSQGAASS
jgi:hypothetical protein